MASVIISDVALPRRTYGANRVCISLRMRPDLHSRIGALADMDRSVSRGAIVDAALDMFLKKLDAENPQLLSS